MPVKASDQRSRSKRKQSPPTRPAHSPQEAGRQLKARRGSLLTFALSPWTWSGWLSGDLGSSFGRGGLQPPARPCGMQPQSEGCGEAVLGAALPGRWHTQPPSCSGRPQHGHLVEQSCFQRASYKPEHKEVPGMGWGSADTQRCKGSECRSGVNVGGLGRGGPQGTSFPREPLCTSPGPAGAPLSGPRRLRRLPPPEQGPRPAPGAPSMCPPNRQPHSWPPAKRLGRSGFKPWSAATSPQLRGRSSVQPLLPAALRGHGLQTTCPTARPPRGQEPRHAGPGPGRCRSVRAGAWRPCHCGGLPGPEDSGTAGQGAGGLPRPRLPGSGFPCCTK